MDIGAYLVHGIFAELLKAAISVRNKNSNAGRNWKALRVTSNHPWGGSRFGILRSERHPPNFGIIRHDAGCLALQAFSTPGAFP